MNQSELETATEKLSNMLEHEDILKWCNEGERVDMINQTNQVSAGTPLSPCLIFTAHSVACEGVRTWDERARECVRE
jgi:hypothetical protein